MKHLKRYSSIYNNIEEFPAANAMLYGTGMSEGELQQPFIGVFSAGFEGNPCNNHLNPLSDKLAQLLKSKKYTPLRFNSIGISDGITMGTEGMRYSLPSREIIADSIESFVMAHMHDAWIGVAGCDKNMPGAVMAALRINKPCILIYGGSIAPGQWKEKALNIVSSFEALGTYKNGDISIEDFKQIIKRSCPGSGACGGMYTANTMAVIMETLGLTLPGSSSFPAVSKEKELELKLVADSLLTTLEKNILPKSIVTIEAIEDAIKAAVALGGSTNLVLHILAIAHTASVPLSLQQIQQWSKETPILADLKPSGKFLMNDLHQEGGTPAFLNYIIQQGIIKGEHLTVTGKTLKENVTNFPAVKTGKIILPVETPVAKQGGLRILYGNIALEGAVAKISGKEGEIFTGKARVFDSEKEVNHVILNGKIQKKTVIVIRYVGPRGAPGMPEMLKPTAAIMGAGMGDEVALITDGRFSGGSHGFVIGHITPEASLGGNIALLQDGDSITIDAQREAIHVHLSEEELAERREKWSPPPTKDNLVGYLKKYQSLVSSASEGCVTDK